MYINFLVNTILFSFFMIIFGIRDKRQASKGMDSVSGYKTPMATKNRDTWEFAQNYAGRTRINIGVINFIILSILIAVTRDMQLEKIYIHFLLLEVAVYLLFIPLTEIALRRRFDTKGKLKRE